MRRLLLAIANSDRGLLGLILGLLVVAGGCLFFMREANPVPPGKTIVTVVKGGTKRDRVQMREIKNAFEAANPDLYLNIIRSNVERKTDTMIAAGVPPDIFWVGVDNVNYYIEAGALLDLMPFVEADPQLRRMFGRTLFNDAPDEEPAFYEQTVAPFVRVVDGRKKLYAMPIDYTPFIIYYSKDLFDRYRVPYPDENWTWADVREKAIALTRDREGRRADHADFDKQHVVSFGFQFATWQHGVENFIRQNGGGLIDETGTRVVADDPRTVAALQFLFDLKYQDGVVPSGQGPGAGGIAFGKGTVGMFLYGSFAIATLNDQSKDLDWDVAPLPRGPDGTRASIVFTNGWGIARGSKHPDAAFRYLKFLVSDQGAEIVSRSSVFLPARRDVLRKIILSDPTRKPRNRLALTHDMDHGYGTPPFATRQFYGDVYEVVNDNLNNLLRLPNPSLTPSDAARRITDQGNLVLRRDQPIQRSTSFGIFALLAGALPAAWLCWRLFLRPRKPLSPLARREERWGYLLVSPWLLGFLLFAAFPIVVSLTLSFAQWQSLSDFTRGQFVGPENYRTAISGDDPKFWPSLWVTFRYALLTVPAGLVAGLALAMLMNQKVVGIAGFRTLYYIPAILPSVAVAVLWWHLFHRDYGWINRVISVIDWGGWISTAAKAIGATGVPIDWLNDEHVTPLVFVVMALWGVGGGMIIYLAGLQGIPTQLYEAAEIDGAGRWQQTLSVTLPMLSPVIFFNLIMGIIGSFQVFNVAFVLYDGATGPADSALFYGLHLFREAFFKYRLGYASALAWILFTIILALTALVFKSSPIWVHYEAARGRRV
jgi:multiple sugar transport system permease protein